jgi:hypothetical protein
MAFWRPTARPFGESALLMHFYACAEEFYTNADTVSHSCAYSDIADHGLTLSLGSESSQELANLTNPKAALVVGFGVLTIHVDVGRPLQRFILLTSEC